MKFEELLEKFIKLGVKADLEKVFRWGDKRHDGFPKENVWQHTTACLVRAKYFLNKYKFIAKELDENKIKVGILLHDGPEAYAIHKDIDYQDPDREKKKLENNEEKVFEDKFINEFKLPLELQTIYLECENQTSKEGTFVKMIDRYDGYIRHWAYLPEHELYGIDEYKNSWDRTFGPLANFYKFVADKNEDLKTDVVNLANEMFHYKFLHIYRSESEKAKDALRVITEYKNKLLKEFIF